MIERRIRDKYGAELKPYQDVVTDFDPLAKSLTDFFTTEAAAIGAFGQKPGTPADEVQMAAVLQSKFSNVPDDISDLKRQIHRDTDATLPPWGELTSAIGTQVDDWTALFDLLSDPEKLKAAKFPPTLAAYFGDSTAKYKKMDADLKAYKDRITKLAPLKVNDVISNLDKDTILILGNDAAKVVTANQIYTATQSAGGGTSPKIFNGEQQISSALFAMSNPNKIKVVFVTVTPQNLLSGNYSDMQQLLQDNNFDVTEWSPPAPPSPDNPSPPSTPPPAEGKGVVWVVFTPEAPDQQAMMFGGGMPDAKPVLEATRRHMAEGGQVLFMADPAGMLSGAAGFAYDDLVKSFGINVQPKYTVWQLRDQVDPDTQQHISQPIPYVMIDRFEKSQITDPIQSLPTVFGPIRTDAGAGVGFVTVVGIQKPLPTGVDAKVLVNTPSGPDYWGETDSAGTPKYDPGVDMQAPMPIAAIGVKNQGQKDKDGSSLEQRIAVFGAKMLGTNFYIDPVQFTDGTTVYESPKFPGNQELMKNTILWLAGYENMIAVSAKVDPAARIGDVSPLALTFIRLGMVALLPLAVLILGGIIWFARHRW